jgi:hypothetical protein
MRSRIPAPTDAIKKAVKESSAIKFLSSKFRPKSKLENRAN